MHIFKNSSWIILFSLTGSFINNVEAQNIDQQLLREPRLKVLKAKIYHAHERASRGIKISSNWMDSFFGNKKSLEQRNETRFRLYNISSKLESDTFSNETAFKFQLRFPNLEKKLQLNFEKKARNEATNTPTPESQLATEEGLGEKKVRGSASYYFKKVLNFNLKFTAGVKIGLPPQAFSRFRTSREVEFVDQWKQRFINNIFWESKEGFGNSTSLDYDKGITRDLFFRFVNESTWRDITDEIKTSHGPTIFAYLSPRRAISYNFRANFKSRPFFHLNDYLASISYRQNLMKNWFFYELSPQLSFDKSRNFESRLGLSFKLELVLGDI